MTRQPEPAPVKPKPIRDDPHHGQLQVVISFRIPRLWAPEDDCRADLSYVIADAVGQACDVYVGFRKIGAGGEQGEDEGRYDQPALTEDVERRNPWRDREDVDTGGKL